MRKLVLLTICILIALTPVVGQKKALSPEDFIISRSVGPDGEEIVGIIAPGIPPANHREPIVQPSRSTVTLPNVPAYDWSFGCSATSAAMAAGYYDNTGYPNMYTGPANGGVAPMTNSTWGTVVINGENRSLCPLSATMNGLDGRTSLGHVDDYWVLYNSSSTDPYITNGWTQHAYSDCTGDYMGTNQSAYANVDGSTTYYFYTNGAPLYDFTGMEPTRIDGCHGQRDFYESRGYQVIHNFSQYILGYNGNTQGMTFNQYKLEIDSGRVVLIHVTGHTMLGYGYDDATSTIYLHDTWDYDNHTMTWGGSYAGLAHYGVTVIKLGPATYGPIADFSASIQTPELGDTVQFTDLSTGSPAPVSWSWSISPGTFNYVAGTSSASRHPKVLFTESGVYSITLVTSNGTNSDTVTKSNFISVLDCSALSLPYGEDFAGGTLPTCWTVIDNIGNGQVWDFTALGGITLNSATGTNGFAMVNSNYYGSGNSQNSDLVSPVFDFSSAMGIMLRFDHYFRAATGSSGTLSYSTDGGNSWTALQIFTTTTVNSTPFSADISSLVAGQSEVRFKWNYTGSNGYYWAVDDISIDTDVPGLWTGAASADWSNPANWANGTVPGSSTNITVHPLAGNWPVVPSDLVLGTTCNNLTINDSAQMSVGGNVTLSSGKSLVFTGAGTLTVFGNWSGQGNFSPGQGTVVFTGNTNTSITLEDITSNVISDYTRSTFPVGMTSLTEAVEGPAGNNGYGDVPIGFDFYYMGGSYSQVRLSTNGFFTFTLSGTGSSNNQLLFSTVGPNPSIAPWWDDLYDDGISLVRYKTEGSAPTRVFTAEWHRVLTYPITSNTRISFQVKLFEATRIVEFHYGLVEGTVHSTNESASIGIEDATGGTNHYIEATTGSSTTAVYNITSASNWPAVNYRFSPSSSVKTFHNILVEKNNATFTINGNITITGIITVDPGAHLKIPPGKTLTINN